MSFRKGKGYINNESPRTLQEKLSNASKQGNLSSLQQLLSHKLLDIDHIGHGGKSALFHAIIHQHIPAVKALIDHHVNVQQASFTTYQRDQFQLISSDEPPIVTAARVDNVEIVEMLLKAGAVPDEQALCHTNLSGVSIKDRTALHFACDNKNVDMVKHLLLFNANVNIKDKKSESAIHLAVRCHKCSRQNQIVSLLCKHGCDVNTVNKIDCPPLYLSSFYGCVQKAETLLSYGANVNKLCERESSYGTALHIAAMKDRYELSNLLIKNGAMLCLRNGLQYTALQLNINSHSKSDIAALLIYHGADSSGLDKFNYTVMAAIIRNMRFDCELLAHLLVYAGYDLNQDVWLVTKLCDDDGTSKRSTNISLRNSRNSESSNHSSGSSRCHSRNSQTSSNDNESNDEIEFPHVPIPDGRISDLCDWLREKQCNPLCLGELCRIVIRKHISNLVEGCSVLSSILSLPLPSAIKDYIALKDLINVDKLNA